ncbi:hypothetical protein HK100_011642 [Physocladia obscura]|uniref:Uncharacterized protein n=1 Tax=Physocladia obscura TaxID=109957 RepID=A0AAD5T1V3_9FUNG|nr:hypothetical protein HK100_011642 [Physocladia obscura]
MSVKMQHRDDSARDGTVYSCQQPNVYQAACSSYKCGPSLLPSATTLDPGSSLWTACPNGMGCTLVRTPSKACSAASIFGTSAEYLPPISSAPTTTIATTTTTTVLPLSQAFQTSAVVVDSSAPLFASIAPSSYYSDPASETDVANTATTTPTTVPVSDSSDSSAFASPTLPIEASLGIGFAVATVFAIALFAITNRRRHCRRNNDQKYVQSQSNNGNENNENNDIFYLPEKRELAYTSESSSVASQIPALLPTPTPPPRPSAATLSNQFPALFAVTAASFGTQKSDTPLEPPDVNISLPKFYYNDTFFDSDESSNSQTTIDNDSNIGDDDFSRSGFHGLDVAVARRISSLLSFSQPAQPSSILLPLTAPLSEASSRDNGSGSSGWGGGIISKGPGALLRWGGGIGNVRGGAVSTDMRDIIGGVIIGNGGRCDSRNSSVGCSSIESCEIKIGNSSSIFEVGSPITVGDFNQLSLSTGEENLVRIIEGRGHGVTFEFEGIQFNVNGPGSGPLGGGSLLPRFQ